MKQPTIALLTDFGTLDPYVGVVKGVILTRAPEARLVDLTHEIPPQNIIAGAYFLRSAVGYFPKGTIFQCVVDPGVGSSRKAVAMRAGEHFFVGPDNGLFTAALGKTIDECVELTETKYHLPSPSTTFHGRDIFAPVAAALAKGVALRKLGKRMNHWIWREIPKPYKTSRGWNGEVLWADHFGNLITNLEPKHLPKNFRLKVGKTVALSLTTHYAAAKKGSVVALIGSDGTLEIAVSGGNAAQKLGVGIGTSVVLG